MYYQHATKWRYWGIILLWGSKHCVAHLFNIGQIQSLPVTMDDMQKATHSNRVLNKVYPYAQNEWPGSVSADLQPFKSKQDETALESGCLVGNLSPTFCQTSVILQSLHM